MTLILIAAGVAVILLLESLLFAPEKWKRGDKKNGGQGDKKG